MYDQTKETYSNIIVSGVKVLFIDLGSLYACPSEPRFYKDGKYMER
jgi:hypothetical protein